MRHVGKATARVTDATEQKPHASRFKRKTPLLSKFKKTLAIGLLSTAVIFTPIGLSAKKNENVKESQQEQKVEIDPNYDYKMNLIFAKGAPGFAIAGNIVPLSDEIRSQLGITEFSGNEKLISVRSPVGWVHYVMNEGWKGILAILQPRNKSDKLFYFVVPSDDGSHISMNYAMDEKGNFAVLTDRGLILFAPSFNGSGYIELAPIIGNLAGASITVKTIETPTGKRTTVEVVPQNGQKYARVDLQTGDVETLLASNR